MLRRSIEDMELGCAATVITSVDLKKENLFKEAPAKKGFTKIVHFVLYCSKDKGVAIVLSNLFNQKADANKFSLSIENLSASASSSSGGGNYHGYSAGI